MSRRNLFLLVLAIRCISVFKNLTWDCDEVYNYWEPLHFLLFGSGLQTWEYSPVYALRSYFYLFIHAAPLAILKPILSKINLFYLLRFLFALITAKLEIYLYESLSNIIKNDRRNIKERFSNLPIYYLLFTITNVGMFLSTTSFLPSTFTMYLIMYAYASLIRGNKFRAVFSVGLATLLGWPFVVILGVPVAIDICFLVGKDYFKQIFTFIKYVLVSGVVIALPMVAVDSYLVGRFVLAPLNIFMYNVFPGGANKGPDLYGREPLSFYLLNGILNFNVLFILALLSVFVLLIGAARDVNQGFVKHARLCALGMFLWIMVFFTRPHKEERFLYPIYPLFLITACVSLCIIERLFQQIRISRRLVASIVVSAHLMLSVMRLIALLKSYSASMDIYSNLNDPSVKHRMSHLENKDLINVCVSKEWYRFPSSFFLPETDAQKEWRLAFLESDFKGQLPGYFNSSLDLPLSTRYIDPLFNDENKEVRSRYVTLKNCDFFIDTDDDNPNDDKIHQLPLDKNTKWKVIQKLKFFKPSDNKNKLIDKLLRAFYVPLLYEKHNEFTYFKLRQRIP